MTRHHLTLKADVTSGERAILVGACARLAEALAQSSGEPWTGETYFEGDGELSDKDTDQPVLVTSLATWLKPPGEDWPAVEARIRAAYAALSAQGQPVFLCTIFRHVDELDDEELAQPLRHRIRQLNLLATEISREHGVFVIDLDRALADIGARRLETDYRLLGEAAVVAAKEVVATCIATNGLDALVSPEVQELTVAALASSRPATGLTTDQMMTNLMALGQGRRRQRVATVTAEVQENHVGWLVRQVLKGQIGRREAIEKLSSAIRRRGARESAWLLMTGVARMAKPHVTGRAR